MSLVIGQPVSFYPSATHSRREDRTDDMPFHATVAHVNEDGTVNLACIGKNGENFSEMNVPVGKVKEKDKEAPVASYCLAAADSKHKETKKEKEAADKEAEDKEGKDEQEKKPAASKPASRAHRES